MAVQDPVALRESLVEAVAQTVPSSSVVLLRPFAEPSGEGFTDVHRRSFDLTSLERVAARLTGRAARLIDDLLSLTEQECAPTVESEPGWLREAPAASSAWSELHSGPWVRVIVRAEALLGVLIVGVPSDLADQARSALESMSPSILESLAEAASMETGASSLDLICDDLGTVVLEPEQSEGLFAEPPRSTRLRRWVRRGVELGCGPWLGLAGRSVSVRPMLATADLEPLWLVRLDPVPPAPRLGRHLLTARQIEVAERARIGEHNREIAQALSLSEGTVKVHLRNVFKVLGVRSRAELGRALDGPAPPC